MMDNIIDYPKNETPTIEPKQDDATLLDCYRIALDFGLPAAKRAFEHLSINGQENSSAEL